MMMFGKRDGIRKKPSGNGRNGGHTSGRGASLEPPSSKGLSAASIARNDLGNERRRWRRAAESACRGASDRAADARMGIVSKDNAERLRRRTEPIGRPLRAEVMKRFSDVSERWFFSPSRRLVDGIRTRYTRSQYPVLYPLSYHSLVPSWFRFPLRYTPGPIVNRRGGRAAGLTGPAACLKETPVGVEPTSDRVAAGRLAVWLQRLLSGHGKKGDRHLGVPSEPVPFFP